MSAGVLAVLDQAAPHYPPLRKAKDTIKELIAAGEEYRDAVKAREADDYGARKVYERAAAAEFRFDAALARAQGKQP